MTYRVTFNGGTKEEVRKAVSAQADESIKAKMMSEDNKKAILGMIDALPGTHLSGTITDNNSGSMVINVTSRTLAEAQLASVRSTAAGRAQEATNPKMASEAANRGGEPVRSTTGAGGMAAKTPENSPGEVRK